MLRFLACLGLGGLVPMAVVVSSENAPLRSRATLVTLAKTAHVRGERHLALVTGVPGAGKTLVDLQVVYRNHFDDQESGRAAVFLSEYGLLVNVLQYILKSSPPREKNLTTLIC